MSMTHEQMVLLCIAEEASEVAKEASKCIRFTPGHTHEGYQDSNYVRLMKEWAELKCMMEKFIGMVNDSSIHPPVSEEELGFWMERKKIRFEQFNKISVEMGVAQ